MKVCSVKEVQNLWQRALDKRGNQVVEVPLEEAGSCVLGQDIVAPFDVPAFDKSAMDGYAICYQEGRRDYRIVGVIGAGQVWDQPLGPGEALRLMTGAAVPPACDTVVRQESVDTTGQVGDWMHIKGPVQEGQHIIGRAEDCLAGTPLLAAGTLIDAQVQSVLAGLGLSRLLVHKPLKALVLTSGREVVEPGRPLGPGQIYNSNRYLLTGLLEDLGVGVKASYHISDDPDLLEQEIERVTSLVEGVDLVISSGGVSVGLFDTMPHIFESLGAIPLYNRIAMRPGAASYGAVTDQGLMIFGLSGNPVAAYNGFQLLVKPTLLRAQGLQWGKSPWLSCICDCDFTKQNPLDRYVQGRMYEKEGALHFTLSGSSSSAAMVSLAGVNALGYIPKGHKSLKKGDFISVLSTKAL